MKSSQFELSQMTTQSTTEKQTDLLMFLDKCFLKCFYSFVAIGSPITIPGNRYQQETPMSFIDIQSTPARIISSMT